MVERVASRAVLSGSTVEVARLDVLRETARRLKSEVQRHVGRTFADRKVTQRNYYVTYEEVIE